MSEASDIPAGAQEQEPLDTLPVLSEEPQTVEARPVAGLVDEQRVAMPAVQAAAVAAGGFVAGAAVVGLVHRRRRRSNALVKGGRRARRLSRAAAGRPGRAGELLQIVGSRSLLVDVHLLGGAEDR